MDLLLENCSHINFALKSLITENFMKKHGNLYTRLPQENEENKQEKKLMNEKSVRE